MIDSTIKRKGDTRSSAFKSKVDRFKRRTDKTLMHTQREDSEEVREKKKKFKASIVKLYSRKGENSTEEFPSIPSNKLLKHRLDKKILYKNIGPTTYNPSYEFVKVKGSTIAKFSLDKAKRHMCGSNADYPGPGQYELYINKQSNPNIKHCILLFSYNSKW